MTKKIIALIGVLLLGFAFNFVSANQLEDIKPSDAKKMVDEKKAILIDVREEDETREGMAKEAKAVPLSLMKEKNAEWNKIVAGFPKDKTVIVYCRSGRRSGIVGEELVKKGYKVQNMGGFDSWKNAGLPLNN